MSSSRITNAYFDSVVLQRHIDFAIKHGLPTNHDDDGDSLFFGDIHHDDFQDEDDHHFERQDQQDNNMIAPDRKTRLWSPSSTITDHPTPADVSEPHATPSVRERTPPLPAPTSHATLSVRERTPPLPAPTSPFVPETPQARHVKVIQWLSPLANLKSIPSPQIDEPVQFDDDVQMTNTVPEVNPPPATASLSASEFSGQTMVEAPPPKVKKRRKRRPVSQGYTKSGKKMGAKKRKTEKE